MNYYILLAVALSVAVVNIPFGYLRQGYPPYSYGWFFYAHITVSAVIYLRVKTGYSWKLLPVILCFAIAGQLIGGRYKRGAASVPEGA
jgi:hypothetical protein